MSLRKIGNRYYIDLWIGPANKRIRRSLHTKYKLEALDRYREEKDRLLAEHLKGEIRFADFCNQYMEWAWQSKPASALREEQRLRIIQGFFEGHSLIHLSDINPYYIEQLKNKLRNEGRSKATTNRYLQLLRGLFYKAIDWEVYDKPNPVKKVRFFKENPKVLVLSDNQIKRILAVARSISRVSRSPLQASFYNLCVLALNTGMRKSEILNLRWSNIKGANVSIRGKGDKVRIIPLNGTAKDVILKQPRRDEYVFHIPNRNQQDLLRRTVCQIRKQTRIAFHFHLLRHYFATKLIENGVDFVTIGSILGHSKITTSLIYSHTSAERMKKAVDSLI